MSCRHYAEQISCLLDNELAAEQSAELFGHLAECADCRSFLQMTLRCKTSARREEIPFPDELDNIVLSNSSRRMPSRLVSWCRRPIVHSRLAVAAAALLVIAGTAWISKIARPAPAAHYEMIFALPTVEVYADEPATRTADSTQANPNMQ